MKKNMFFHLILILIVSSSAYSQKKSEFIQNGITFKGYTNNNLKFGVWEGLIDSRRVEIRTYFNDSLNGILMKFDRTGRITEVIDFKDNKINGIRLLLDSNQNIEHLRYYEKGDVSGINLSFYDSGKIFRESIWPSRNVPTYFNSIEMFDDGSVYDYYLDDSTLYSGNTWYSNGNVKVSCKIQIRADTTYNTFKQYYPNGKLQKEGCLFYVNDLTRSVRLWEECCIWKIYSLDGTFKKEEYSMICP
jgi:antitoxin component YwqK of YwqJK toxin-antitoxin module